MVYVYRYGNNCQTAHPTRAPLLSTTDSRYRYSTAAAVRSYINDDESTVLGTDVPFAGSRDTVGKKGSSRESSVFQTRVERNAAMMMSRTYCSCTGKSLF